MKFIVAIIKPFKLDDLRDALAEIDVQGLTVSEVQGYGRQKGHSELYRGSEYSTNFVPKLKVEIAVVDELSDKVVETIIQSTKTGQIGDGKIFVFDLQHTIRIRTGETDAGAL
jgi:nitrogen regulatory protein P-II 2